MKNKFYRSLLVGIGLAIAATSSYAKPHIIAYKRIPATTKPSKKDWLHASRHHGHSRRSSPVRELITQLKQSHKKTPSQPGYGRSFSKRKLPNPGQNFLEKNLPPLLDNTYNTSNKLAIPHLPSDNPYTNTDLSTAEPNKIGRAHV